MRCDECTYFVGPECHRFPPLDGFPTVRDNSWCGEFKAMEVNQDAVEERKIEESSVRKHPGVDALRQATETGDSHSDEQGRQVQEQAETVKRRGWPKGKPRK